MHLHDCSTWQYKAVGYNFWVLSTRQYHRHSRLRNHIMYFLLSRRAVQNIGIQNHLEKKNQALARTKTHSYHRGAIFKWWISSIASLKYTISPIYPRSIGLGGSHYSVCDNRSGAVCRTLIDCIKSQVLSASRCNSFQSQVALRSSRKTYTRTNHTCVTDETFRAISLQECACV